MKFVIIGHSHIRCFFTAYKRMGLDSPVPMEFIQLRDIQFYKNQLPPFSPRNLDKGKFRDYLKNKIDPSAIVILCPVGNEHTVVSLVKRPNEDVGALKRSLEARFQTYVEWLDLIKANIRNELVVIPPPPPIESREHIIANPANFGEQVVTKGVTDSEIRLDVWRHQIDLIKETARKLSLKFFGVSEKCLTAGGFLRPEYYGQDPLHANPEYGTTILNELIARLEDSTYGDSARSAARTENARPSKRNHPYVGLPDTSFWKQSVSSVPPDQVDPSHDGAFVIGPEDFVATAGSCFAQHISKRIRSAGFQFYVAEKTKSAASEQHFDFSARYGNIYTARQLKQLFDRSFDRFTPVDSAWLRPDGNYCDPFRPQIEASGFATTDELEEDRTNHLRAVREMFENLDVFVFTLGLTECWLSRVDGAAFPIAPGVAGGEFDEKKYRFENFSVYEVVADLQSFLDGLRRVNPAARLLLTVSPVPLVATYEDRHVLVSTTYSKSVLRVAAEMIMRQNEGVVYFPSYEVIVGNFNRGAYFGEDLRSVTESGVDHVMRLFMSRMTESPAAELKSAGAQKLDEHEEEMVRLAEAACDEELLQKDSSD